MGEGGGGSRGGGKRGGGGGGGGKEEKKRESMGYGINERERRGGNRGKGMGV